MNKGNGGDATRTVREDVSRTKRNDVKTVDTSVDDCRSGVDDVLAAGLGV